MKKNNWISKNKKLKNQIICKIKNRVTNISKEKEK